MIFGFKQVFATYLPDEIQLCRIIIQHICKNITQMRREIVKDYMMNCVKYILCFCVFQEIPTSSLAALSLMSDGRGGFTGASYLGLDADGSSSSLASSGSGHELNFFCFLLVKSQWFVWKANQWPLSRELIFSFVPPRNSLVSVSNPWRAFWADTLPFKGPWLAPGIASRTTKTHEH